MSDQIKSESKRANWVDAAKFLAIMGVLVDHTDGILYTDKKIAYLSYYSVSLFILLMGVTAFWSYKKTAGSLPVSKKLKKNCLKIIVPYLEATLICCIFAYKRLQLSEILDHLIHFNASGPFYYVLLYLQLVLITPALFYIFQTSDRKKNGFLAELTGFAFVIIIGRLANYHTNILSIYGGGGKLFGGHYLILFYIGMWFGKYSSRISLKPWASVVGFALSLGLTVFWGFFIAKDRLHLDALLHCAPGLNPPGFSLSIYAILIAAAVYFFSSLLDDLRKCFLTKPFSFFTYLGKHTLYVFLYHMLFLNYIIPSAAHAGGFRIRHLLLKAAVYFTVIYAGSFLIEIILKKFNSVIKNFFIQAYTSDRSNPI